MLEDGTFHVIPKGNNWEIAMTYEVSVLNQSHNEELLTLANVTNTGSDLFIVDRSPNFFTLSEEFGETTQYGLFKDGQLIGNVAVSKQSRMITGKREDVYYLNDLRIHPDFQKTRAYYRLIEHVLQTYRSMGHVKWMFSTVLDSNIHKANVIKGSTGIPGGIKIGASVHIGIPMFIKHKKRNENVIEISGEEAWEVYRRYAKRIEFAPFDKNLFLRENGMFLAIKDNNGIKAVCKLIDQSMSRTLRLSKKLPHFSKFVNILCKVKGCPLLPSVGEPFYHGYLSFYVSNETATNHWQEFLSYIQEYHYSKFTYVFTGIATDEALAWNKTVFHQVLSSTTYAYGEFPSNLSLQFHELTLI